VYAFENDNGDTPQNNPTLPLGAFHNAENPFLFPSPALTLTPNQAALGAQIVAQWSGFARTGNPTVEGARPWPLYKNERLVMSLVSSGGSAMTSAAFLDARHHCGFWDTENRLSPWAPR
jgi:para-nitrobenzyl esterase